MRIAGELVDGDTGNNIEVLNPYSGEVVGTVPRASRAQIAGAFEIAASYKATLTRYERQKILMRIAEIIVERKAEISDLITAECGLSKKDSLYEVGRAFDVYSLAGQLCINDDSEVFSCDLTPHGKQRKIFTQRDPLLGAISAITPFNHPLNMISHKIAPAIATNNCMVAKPTEQTPLTALILADIIYEAGLPPEMLSVVTGLPQDMGDEMLTNKHIDLISFTGSVPVGKYIAETAGYRRTVLELGGNSPLIVMDDADLDKAAELAVAGGTKNSGQRCTAVKRVLCIDSAGDEFAALVAEKAAKLKYGDPMDPDTDVGTVINEASAILFQRKAPPCFTATTARARFTRRRCSITCPTIASWCARKPSAHRSLSSACAISITQSRSPTRPHSACLPASAPTAWTISSASSTSWKPARSTSGKCRATASKCRPSAASRIRASATRKALSKR
jgi:putative phosphonoacetaldehyde dehydrogenase